MYGDKQIMAYTTSEYQKRILLRMGKDQYEIANLLKKQLDRATIHYERSIRDKDSAIDLDYWKGNRRMVCRIADDIAHYFQDKAKGVTMPHQHANISQEYSAFLQKVGWAD